MRKTFSRLSVLALAAVSLSGAAFAQGTPVTFLQLRQVTSSQQPFVLTDLGADSFFSVAQVGGAVVGTPATFDGFQATINGVDTVVNLTISGNTTSPAIQSVGSGGITFLSQEFTGLQFRVATANAPLVNILTVDASSAVLFGTVGATSATFLRSNTDTGSPSVVFTSDVFDFTGSDRRAFSFGFSSVDPNMMLGNNDFIDSFNAAGVGTFSSNGDNVVSVLVTPEPSAVAVAAIMGAGLVGMMVRGRRRSSK